MTKKTTISHPVIKSYVDNFISEHEISKSKAKNQHGIFEQYINDLILSIYSNDPSVTYQDMETGSAFGIDGVAIFVSDRVATSTEDVDSIIEGVKKFEVSFFFTQSKTTDQFDRTDISDFFTAVRRFFNFNKCEIPELREYWDVAKYIYSKGSKFKRQPSLNMKFITLSPKEIDLTDIHMKSEIDLGLNDLNDMSLFNEVKVPDFLGIKDIMSLHEKNTSGLEVSVTLTKLPVPYPKDTHNKIKNGYYGLIKLEEFILLLTDEVNNEKILRKGIFNDNIRYYLGSSEKIEVNTSMKNQLLGTEDYLFGLLNNGITIIADEISLSSDDLTLTNYQIVNGCQTSNVIFECLESIEQSSDIYIPIRLISTEDEDTKHSIIKATNSQTQLKPEQLVALSAIQKAIEQYYNTKAKGNSCPLYYERRTEQYRDENIPKTKIINIPFQIKATSALFFDLPHEVSGQYGKVVKQTGDLLFKDTHLSFLNSYYVSGLAWYKVERFVLNNEDGKRFRRARWHIIMILKYLC
ncbi:AIPR family protein, partial [Listeria monocytogenes]|nr:AIPR family protein [Listeria monocytogenes]EGP8522862.1 AIPR family protein [Listeria monocytogenes]